MLKERMEYDKIKKIREEIEIVMCTYYGKGKENKDRLIDFVETLKVVLIIFIMQIEKRTTIERRGIRVNLTGNLNEIEYSDINSDW